VPGIQGLFESIIYAKGGAPVTVKEAAMIYAQGMGMPVAVGTAADIADQMEHYMDDGGADGFMLAATYTPGCFEEFADYVVPELQRRGRFRTRYTGYNAPGEFALELRHSPWTSGAWTGWRRRRMRRPRRPGQGLDWRKIPRGADLSPGVRPRDYAWPRNAPGANRTPRRRFAAEIPRRR
jgi:Phosphotransacetylase